MNTTIHFPDVKTIIRLLAVIGMIAVMCAMSRPHIERIENVNYMTADTSTWTGGWQRR